ncbi:MAG: hypothetical protein V4697_00230 [Patescibacteria group bacterium]
MSKTLRLLLVLSICILPVFAHAATTASLSPASISSSPQSQFTVLVSVDPQGTENFAEKVELKFPADLLEVRGWNFSPQWVALTQSEYDRTDNTSGVLIKTAGYPSGITSKTSFGTVTFFVKKAGSGTITIGNSSSAFLAKTQTPMTGTGATVNSVAYVAPTPVVQPVPKKVVVAEPVPVVVLEATSTIEIATTTEEIATSTQTAALADALPESSSRLWLWIILGIVAVVVIGLVVRARATRV